MCSVGRSSPVFAADVEATASASAVQTREERPGLVSVSLPLHLSPVGNRREHWRSRARRVRRETAAILAALKGHAPPPLPVVVDLCRTGWNLFDPEGLCGACKTPIDALARWLGVDDRDRRIFWRLAQAITREVRLVPVRRRGYLIGERREAASVLRIVVRAWRPSDGDDPLRVLARPRDFVSEP